jgi:hypothetical protein
MIALYRGHSVLPDNGCVVQLNVSFIQTKARACQALFSVCPFVGPFVLTKVSHQCIKKGLLPQENRPISEVCAQRQCRRLSCGLLLMEESLTSIPMRA